MADQKIEGKDKDWSDLPSELVHLIAKKLPNILDYIRVHLTCKSWFSSTPLAEFSIHFPWLIEFPQEPHNLISVPTTKLCLYSMLAGEALTIPIKESRWFRGSTNNYLPLIDDCTGTMSLFNPLNNDEFVLPLVHDRREPYASLIVGTEPGPIRDRRILIVDHGDYRRKRHPDRWAIYNPHHGRWSEQQGLCIFSCYCHGMFFHTDTYAGSETNVFDASTKSLLYTIPPHEDETRDAHLHREQLGCIRYLTSYVVDSSGDILRVYWYYSKQYLAKSKFQFYRLSFEARGQPCWDKISDIGDQILFLEALNGISNAANGFLVKGAAAIGLKGRLIYFIDPCNGKPYMYDIVSGTAKMVPCPFDKCTWFVPGLC